MPFFLLESTSNIDYPAGHKTEIPAGLFLLNPPPRKMTLQYVRKLFYIVTGWLRTFYSPTCVSLFYVSITTLAPRNRVLTIILLNNKQLNDKFTWAIKKKNTTALRARTLHQRRRTKNLPCTRLSRRDSRSCRLDIIIINISTRVPKFASCLFLAEFAQKKNRQGVYDHFIRMTSVENVRFIKQVCGARAQA